MQPFAFLPKFLPLSVRGSSPFPSVTSCCGDDLFVAADEAEQLFEAQQQVSKEKLTLALPPFGLSEVKEQESEKPVFREGRLADRIDNIFADFDAKKKAEQTLAQADSSYQEDQEDQSMSSSFNSNMFSTPNRHFPSNLDLSPILSQEKPIMSPSSKKQLASSLSALPCSADFSRSGSFSQFDESAMKGMTETLKAEKSVHFNTSLTPQNEWNVKMAETSISDSSITVAQTPISHAFEKKTIPTFTPAVNSLAKKAIPTFTPTINSLEKKAVPTLTPPVPQVTPITQDLIRQKNGFYHTPKALPLLPKRQKAQSSNLNLLNQNYPQTLARKARTEMNLQSSPLVSRHLTTPQREQIGRGVQASGYKEFFNGFQNATLFDDVSRVPTQGQNWISNNRKHTYEESKAYQRYASHSIQTPHSANDLISPTSPAKRLVFDNFEDESLQRSFSANEIEETPLFHARKRPHQKTPMNQSLAIGFQHKQEEIGPPHAPMRKARKRLDINL